MDEMVNLILNSSVSIVVIVFFMYRDLKFTVRLEQTLTALVDAVNTLTTLIHQKGEDDGK